MGFNHLVDTCRTSSCLALGPNTFRITVGTVRSQHQWFLAYSVSYTLKRRNLADSLEKSLLCCHSHSTKGKLLDATRLTGTPCSKRFSSRAAPNGSNTAARIACEGDTVTVHFTVYGENGDRMESSRDAGQPLTFEVGASDVVSNELLQAFDGGVRGLGVGATRRIELEPLQSEWSQDLLFNIPREHPEVQRLEGKFRGTGGLQEGMIVELANGSQAQVLKVSTDNVVLDANNAMAGRRITFELELVSIEEPTD